MKLSSGCPPPLPISWEECRQRGWSHLDVLLITGDAYIDHPSFGVALIGRLLESHGFRVAILPQPRYDTAGDFKSFPPPRLFCGITAGNLDSIVANYSGNGKVRDTDAYSPNGNPWRGGERLKTARRRPDRACLLYTSLARSAFRDVPIVLGGIEASLRRFVHYDFKQEKLRSSFLTDAKADLLVYGMGEKAIVEIARRCAEKKPLSFIAGTCQRFTDQELQGQFPAQFAADSPAGQMTSSQKFLVLPSWATIQQHNRDFLLAETEIDKHSRASSARIILQRQQSHWVVQHPAAKPLSPDELDALYSLPYTRRPHPHDEPIPAFRMIKDSVTIVRGCSGNCSFCAITRHQGPAIVSRSRESIGKECLHISQMDDFTGTISDLGGPTANLYGTHCAIGSCQKRDCLYPKLCAHLKIDEDLFLHLLDDIAAIDGVKKVFISSGLRMELLLRTPRLMKKILQAHTPGSLKIAPEHTDDELLRLMHKEPHALLQKFVAECRRIGKEIGKDNIEFTPYVITAHPGSTPRHAEKLAQDMQKLGLQIRKPQDFTPTPGTLSTAMYVTGLKPGSGEPLTVPRKQSDRMLQRKILHESLPQDNVRMPKTGPRKKK
jgi:uncharacterized radical SAM protein YgiQ